MMVLKNKKFIFAIIVPAILLFSIISVASASGVLNQTQYAEKDVPIQFFHEEDFSKDVCY